ncbi:MAG: hypothetical protein ABL898_16970 [Hyphomicrobiaceae bacterium]|nr:hypothetical protein [Hyphomicrobiaceae bacterium]
MDGSRQIDGVPGGGPVEPDGGGLLPPKVRHGLWLALGAVMVSALYLISVRGTAIIFDIASAVGSYCF